MKKTTSGFTIVELLIVVVVVGILAAITVVAYNGVQARSRDAARKSDLAAAAKAFEVRAVDYDASLTSGDCTTGFISGWFSFSGVSPTGGNYGAKPAAECLKSQSNTNIIFKDPTGTTACANGVPETCYAYMFSSCSGTTYVYAHLETIATSTTAADGTCSDTFDSSFGMNYYVKASAY